MKAVPEAPYAPKRGSLAQRLKERAKLMPNARRPSALRQLIEARCVLVELRSDGMSSEQLQKLLEHEGIHLASGTIRNYLAQIDRAIRTLDAMDNSDPDDDEIHKMVLLLGKTSEDADDPGLPPAETHRNLSAAVMPTPGAPASLHLPPHTNGTLMRGTEDDL